MGVKWRHLSERGQQLFDGGGQAAGTRVDLPVVGGLQLLGGLQGLLRQAQRAFHLLQLLAQRLVGLLHAAHGFGVLI